LIRCQWYSTLPSTPYGCSIERDTLTLRSTRRYTELCCQVYPYRYRDQQLADLRQRYQCGYRDYYAMSSPRGQLTGQDHGRYSWSQSGTHLGCYGSRDLVVERSRCHSYWDHRMSGELYIQIRYRMNWALCVSVF
jgi:hypothetical protein